MGGCISIVVSTSAFVFLERIWGGVEVSLFVFCDDCAVGWLGFGCLAVVMLSRSL